MKSKRSSEYKRKRKQMNDRKNYQVKKRKSFINDGTENNNLKNDNLNKINKEFLNNEQKETVEAVLAIEDIDHLIIEKKNIKITRASIKLLENKNWLDDKIIDFYLNLIMEANPKVLCLSSFFYLKLLKNSNFYDYNGIIKWIKDTNFSNYELIFVPVCQSNHWFLIMIDIQNKKINLYDSKNGNREDVLNLFFNFIKDYFYDINESVLEVNFWTKNAIKNIPLQKNNYDCGVFLCIYANYLATKKSFLFDQSSIQFFRKCMIYEIITGKLIGIDKIPPNNTNESSEINYIELFNCDDLMSICSSLENDYNLKNDENTPFDDNFGDFYSDSTENFSEIDQGNCRPKLIINKQIKTKNFKMKIRKFIALKNDFISSVEQFTVGRREIECKFCNALFYKGQSKNCCKNGNIKLKLLKEPPKLLIKLFNNDHKYSDIFFKHIRMLNSLFSFASIGEPGLDKELANSKKGGFTYRILGQIYHRVGSLLPVDNSNYCFSQLIFYDAELALLKRHQILNNNTEILNSKVLLSKIQNCLDKNNKLINIYKQFGKKILKKPEKVLVIKDNYKNIDIKIYNKPKENDFAALVSTDHNDLLNKRDIIVEYKNNKLKRINHTHALADPLCYPLIHCYGDPQWNINLKIQKKITLRDYSRFYYQFRKNNFNIFYKARKLSHQHVTHKFIDIETEDLNYLKFNQAKLRVDLYKGLADSFNEKIDLNDIGKRYILPSTHIGSPRHMQQLYNDAMSLVMKYGKPDLFITMTCNPVSTDITNGLFDGQTSWDRFDLVGDIFKINVDQLIYEVKNKRIFGIVSAYVGVIENQKRGLPHIHLLVILDKRNKLDTPELINSCISAEIPHPKKQLELYNIVKKFMIHRPCKSNFKSVCYKNNRCSKKFPKQHQKQTEIIDGYPVYRRRNRQKIDFNGQLISDEYVVPYNPYLLKRFNCHINVEICASIKGVKYLYKYIYKGSPKAIVKITDLNEIDSYLNNRYISSNEAYWRIKSYKLYHNYPSVCRLPVHLEDEHPVAYNPNQTKEEIETLLIENRKTKFTEWLDFNSKNSESHNLTYEQFAEKYVWVEHEKKMEKKNFGGS